MRRPWNLAVGDVISQQSAASMPFHPLLFLDSVKVMDPLNERHAFPSDHCRFFLHELTQDRCKIDFPATYLSDGFENHQAVGLVNLKKTEWIEVRLHVEKRKCASSFRWPGWRS